MKKVKYYAPYWVSALVVIALAVFLINRFGTRTGNGIAVYTPFSELPELAAELESNDYFISEDGVVMKRVGGTQVSVHLAKSEEHDPNVIDNFKPGALSDMLPHEYAALILQDKIYIRKDGQVFAPHGNSNTGSKKYIRRICPPSQLPENAVKSDWEITAPDSISRDIPAISVSVPAADLKHAAVWTLSVKLKDGWYEIADGSHTHVTVDSQSNMCYIFDVQFPALLEGDYRLEVNIGDEWFYQDMTLTGKDIITYTLTY